ncbi:MAG: beta-propeller fold lactonase family protein [Nitrospira sp.]|nr:beta-propeller fold lactonase family protein [Nitrospira sp.]
MRGLFPLVILVSGCGDDGGSGGGFGGTGETLGGLGTTSILYVANNGSDNVSGYSINATGGTLVAIPGSPFSNVSGPSAMAVSSNGFFAYVTNSRTNTVTAFRVSTEGALLLAPTTQSNRNPTPIDATPSALAISPDIKHVYVANRGADTVTAFDIGASGALTLIPPTADNSNPVSVRGTNPVANPAAIAITQNGKFLYIANSASNDVTAFSIGATGLLSLIAPSGTNANPVTTSVTAPKSMAISPNGSFLYVANSGSHNVTVFQIGANGLLTLVPPAGSSTNPVPIGSTSPNSLMISSNGRFLYSANGGGAVSGFTIGGDGLLTLIPSSAGNPVVVGTNTNPVALTLSPDERFLYVAHVRNQEGRVSAYGINIETGALVPLTTLVGNPFLAGTTPSAIATPGRP